MASELSIEMKQELVVDIEKDAQAILQRTQGMREWHGSQQQLIVTHQNLEQLTYITEQIRLKLRLLGAPRIYQ